LDLHFLELGCICDLRGLELAATLWPIEIQVVVRVGFDIGSNITVIVVPAPVASFSI
jgi:hypothetical protein